MRVCSIESTHCTVEFGGFAVHPVLPVADLNTCCKTCQPLQGRKEFHFRLGRATESLESNYSASGIVPAPPAPYARRSKCVPSNYLPPRQVPDGLDRLDRHLPLALLRNEIADAGPLDAEIQRAPYGLT